MTRGSCKGRERNIEGVEGVEETTQGIIGATQMREGVAVGIVTIGGATCTN